MNGHRLSLRLLLLLPAGCIVTGEKDSATPSAETCNGLDDDLNGIVDDGFTDSDGDGIADCVDDSCDIVIQSPSTVDIQEECRGVESGGGGTADPWNVAVEWVFNSTDSGVIVLPVVGNVTDDNDDGAVDSNDIPDIAFTTWGNEELTLLSGDGSGPHWAVASYGLSGPSIADLDADGFPEVIGLNSTAQVVAWDAEGMELWVSDDLSAYLSYYPQSTVADLDGDGFPEVIFDTVILDGLDGTVLATLSPGTEYRTPVVADLDQDGHQEIILGESVYDYEGNLIFAADVGTYGSFNAVLQADDDPDGEVVFVRAATVSIYDMDGTLVKEYPISGTNSGPPAVADFDGDGEPEIAVPTGSYIGISDLDGTELWAELTDDSSGLAGCSAFDFDNDGVYELVYADQDVLRIYNGPDGTVLYADTDHSNGTVWEYPVIADVDADGAAELVVARTTLMGTPDEEQGVAVYGQIDNTWPPAGPGWQIHDYNNVNIDPDSLVPAQGPNFWDEPGLFRARAPADDISSADLVVTIGSFCAEGCPTGTVTIPFDVANQGAVDVEEGTPISLYAVGGDETFLVDTQYLPAIPAGTSLETGYFEVTPSYFGSGGYLVWVDRDEDGRGHVRECDETNNKATYVGYVCEP